MTSAIDYALLISNFAKNKAESLNLLVIGLVIKPDVIIIEYFDKTHNRAVTASIPTK